MGKAWGPDPVTQPSADNQRKPAKRRRWPYVLIVGALVLVVGIALGSGGGSKPGASAPAPSPTAPADPIAAPTSRFGDGTYIVGTDVEPGTYRSTGAEPDAFAFCLWSTRAGASSNSDVIDFGSASKPGEPQVVKITSAAKAFVTQGCAEWVRSGS